MRHSVNPLQIRLFDAYDPVLTEKTRKRLLEHWPGVLGLDFARLRGLQVLGGVRRGLQRSWGPSFEQGMNFSVFSQVA
jgi:hypothetical protein